MSTLVQLFKVCGNTCLVCGCIFSPENLNEVVLKELFSESNRVFSVDRAVSGLDLWNGFDDGRNVVEELLEVAPGHWG